MAQVAATGAVDGFSLLETIHSGGFGVVHRVTRPGLDVPLVMKIPRLAPGDPASGLASHEAERAILAALSGPHVPRLVAAGELTERPYLVLEEVRGTSLEAHAGRAPLPAQEVARLGAATARALEAVHAQRVLHLDVKPENVILRQDGRAVLIDFGLARHADLPDLVAEEVIQPMGSAAYVSPEQLLGVREDPRSDLFSLGVVLYQLTTGRLPFGNPASSFGLRRRLYRDPIPPRVLAAATPPWLQELVLWCLEPDAHHRPASAAELAGYLERPDTVPLSARAARTRRDGAATVLLRWIRAGDFEAGFRAGPPPVLGGRRTILVAVATMHRNEARHQLLREAVGRILAADPLARLTCVCVTDPSPGAPAAARGPSAGLALRHLGVLKQWAKPLRLPEDRVSYHVLESTHAASAILEYLRSNPVHHVVVGSPPADEALKRIFGTFSSKIANEAPCSVTVVRYPS